jgi:hypothetical protein
MAVGGSVKVKTDRGGDLQDEAAVLDSRLRKKPARNEFVGAVRIIHHIQWQYRISVHNLLFVENCFNKHNDDQSRG